MKVHTFVVCAGRWLLLVAAACVALLATMLPAQVTVAQLSDTHIGDKHAPHAADNLRQAVEMINDRHPDAVILSGDIGENPEAWDEARSILKKLKSPLYYAPGNHDVHSNDVERYRRVFGKDYYSFDVKNVTFVVIDSQLLGNFDIYDAKKPEPLPPQTEDESERMMAWLEGLRDSGDVNKDQAKKDDGRKDDHRNDEVKSDRNDQARGRIMIGVQHIPAFCDEDFPKDTKPYWVVNDPYRSREMKALHDLGIKDMLVGHWHNGRLFEKEGITWHVAPATSWLPWGGELGFAMHTISPNGDVHTEFVMLPGARP